MQLTMYLRQFFKQGMNFTLQEIFSNWPRYFRSTQLQEVIATGKWQITSNLQYTVPTARNFLSYEVGSVKDKKSWATHSTAQTSRSMKQNRI